MLMRLQKYLSTDLLGRHTLTESKCEFTPKKDDSLTRIITAKEKLSRLDFSELITFCFSQPPFCLPFSFKPQNNIISKHNAGLCSPDHFKIKSYDWLLVDTCPQAANHCALF